MKKNVILFLLLFFIISIYSDILHSDIVFRKRLEEFNMLESMTDKIRNDISSISIPEDDFAITSAMHNRLDEIFVQFLFIQKNHLKNWQDFVTFRRLGLPSDYSMQDRSVQSDFSIELTGLGILSRIRQFENNIFIMKILEKNSIILKKYDEVCAMSESDHKRMLSQIMNKNDRNYIDIYDDVNSNSTQQSLVDACNTFLDMIRTTYGTDIPEDNNTMQYLISEITESTLIEEFSDSSFLTRFFSWFDIFLKDSADSIAQSFSSLKAGLSKFFGNSVGSLKSDRAPYLNIEENIDIIRDKLQPGDILVEKAGFLLTDKFIPGHFGHVAIYSGKPEEMLPVFSNLTRNTWNRRVTVLASKEEKDIDHYYTNEVLEALRPGVTIRPLEHFLYIDDLAVLRLKDDYVPDNLGREYYLEKVISKGYSYLGTDYDFAFDVNSASKIVCSEMPYQCMKGIPFRVKETLGSWNISPDDVAVGAGNTPERPFELVMFIHKGELIREEPLEKYISILESEGSLYNSFPQYSERADYSEYKW